MEDIDIVAKYLQELLEMKVTVGNQPYTSKKGNRIWIHPSQSILVRMLVEPNESKIYLLLGSDRLYCNDRSFISLCQDGNKIKEAILGVIKCCYTTGCLTCPLK